MLRKILFLVFVCFFVNGFVFANEKSSNIGDLFRMSFQNVISEFLFNDNDDCSGAIELEVNAYATCASTTSGNFNVVVLSEGGDNTLY